MDSEKQAEITDLNGLLDSVSEEVIRRDLVYTLMIKAWDIGYVDGFNEARYAIADREEATFQGEY